MKKYTPYVLPLAVLAVVFLLVFRWYNTRTEPLSEETLFGEGVEIENLTDAEAQEAISGAGDFETVAMEAQDGTAGSVRYEVEDNKVKFSVIGNLPDPESGTYYVWLKDVDSDSMRQAFTLELGKGGYVGSAALSADLLPFEVIVSDESEAEKALQDVVLRAVVERE
jgi:hypothetical protein